MRYTFTFMILFLGGCLSVGFTLAMLLDQGNRGEGFFCGVYLFPMAISFIVTGVAWRWLLDPGTVEGGATGVNLLFEYLRLDFLKWGWFTDPKVIHIRPESGLGQFLGSVGLGWLASPTFGMSVAILSLVLAATWQMSGYPKAMYLAGLRAIPDELREAAPVDGATDWHIVRHIISSTYLLIGQAVPLCRCAVCAIRSSGRHRASRGFISVFPQVWSGLYPFCMRLPAIMKL